VLRIGPDNGGMRKRMVRGHGRNAERVCVWHTGAKTAAQKKQTVRTGHALTGAAPFG